MQSSPSHPSHMISCEDETGQQHASLLTMDRGYAGGTIARPRTILLSSNMFHDGGRKVNPMNLINNKAFLSVTGILIVTAVANLTIAMWVIRILQLGNVGIA